MKKRFITWSTLCLFFLLGTGFLNILAQEKDLSKQNWLIWMDEEAEWKDDTLFLPGEFRLEDVPENAPTCGWEEVYSMGKQATLPVVVEELYSGGDARWVYRGVSWFTTEFDASADWEDQVIRLYVGKKNRRLEIYVNEKLAGYDLIYAAPYSCDISEYIKPGEPNRLAFRITNPGGSRGWGDFPMVKWGEFLLPFGRDFGGIGAMVNLTVTDPVYVKDLFVQNLQPALANKVAVELQLQNETSVSHDAQLELQVLDGNIVLYSESKSVNNLAPGENLVNFEFKVPEALQWDIAQPNLYTCKVSVKSGEFTHQFERVFGFRVFEVKANEEGEQNYYLNGKRFRHRSAIDWSMYAHHGFYPSNEMAELSITNALAIGHNGINFHRHMADEILLETADKMGLLVYEEPGGFDPAIDITGKVWGEKSFEGRLMAEQCLRMAKRDRHHVSVAGYILANEREEFDLLRKNIMIDMHELDPSKLIVNQSGGHPGGAGGQIPHIRPYDKKFRLDYFGDHTVSAEERFMEFEFHGHQGPIDRWGTHKWGRIDPLAHDNIIYWGEVRCYTGPDNWFEINGQAERLQDGRAGYDRGNSENLAMKTKIYFEQNRFDRLKGSGIESPSDLSVQAGKGIMYSDGRLGQIIMSNNSADGYAINGWSGGSFVLPQGYSSSMEWYSALTDEGRNLKGPAEDLSYWIRPLQIAIFRMNGKYFEPGDTIELKIDLINEGVLKAGSYDYRIGITDGAGKSTGFKLEGSIDVEGGDCYAQSIAKKLLVPVSGNWNAGYLTIEGTLLKNEDEIADGVEQVLLKNRATYQDVLNKHWITVNNWPAAEEALADAGYSFSAAQPGKKIILAGNPVPAGNLRTLLREVQAGASLIIRFDSVWADLLHESKILSRPVTRWGGEQIGHWNGNGWGFIHGLAGEYCLPENRTIGTNAWEVPGDPVGFYPFESKHTQTSYGAWFARPDQLLTLYGEISYGKGRILLAPSYPVDDDNVFNDLLFYNMILR